MATNTTPDSVETLAKLPNNALVYRTTKAIDNPVGDGRHNRAAWRPEFDKNSVAAGTLFAMDSEGNLYELSRAVRVISAAKAPLLRDRLMAVATDPLQYDFQEEETVEAVAETLGGANAVLAKLCESLGVTPDKLRAVFAAEDAALPSPGVTVAPQESASSAKTTTTVRKNASTVPAAAGR